MRMHQGTYGGAEGAWLDAWARASALPCFFRSRPTNVLQCILPCIPQFILRPALPSILRPPAALLCHPYASLLRTPSRAPYESPEALLRH